MKGYATTTISIFRASTQDDYGDSVDDNSTPIASGVIASIIEQSRRAFLAAENRKTVVKNSIARMKNGTDLLEGDRIKDEQTGQFFYVEAVSTPATPRGKPDVRAVCRAVNR